MHLQWSFSWFSRIFWLIEKSRMYLILARQAIESHPAVLYPYLKLAVSDLRQLTSRA